MRFIQTPYHRLKEIVASKYGKKSIYSCSKSMFFTPEKALAKLHVIAKEQAINGKKPTRFYKCYKCNAYHLTSMDIDLYNELVEIKTRSINSRIARTANYWEDRLNVA